MTSFINAIRFSFNVPYLQQTDNPYAFTPHAPNFTFLTFAFGRAFTSAFSHAVVAKISIVNLHPTLIMALIAQSLNKLF